METCGYWFLSSIRKVWGKCISRGWCYHDRLTCSSSIHQTTGEREGQKDEELDFHFGRRTAIFRWQFGHKASLSFANWVWKMARESWFHLLSNREQIVEWDLVPLRVSIYGILCHCWPSANLQHRQPRNRFGRFDGLAAGISACRFVGFGTFTPSPLLPIADLGRVHEFLTFHVQNATFILFTSKKTLKWLSLFGSKHLGPKEIEK